MEWVFIIGGLLTVALILLVRANRKKKESILEGGRHYASAIETEKQHLLTGNNSASLPALETSDYGYRPLAKENLLAVQEAVARIEMKSTGRYQTAGILVSIPIVKGLRYRVGSRTIQTKKKWQATAQGRLLVTDKALVFEGGDKNERITWTQVANVELLMDGFIVAKRSGPPRTYLVTSPDPKFAAVIELMLARTQ